MLNLWFLWLLPLFGANRVSNGAEPVGPRFTLAFHEDLRIPGARGAGMNAPLALVVDQFDNFYAIDARGEKILGYGPDGEVFREYRFGPDDPVQFVLISNLRVLQDGTLQVFGITENARIIRDLDGSISQVSNVEGGFVRLAPDGRFPAVDTDPVPTLNLMDVRFSPQSEVIFARYAVKTRYTQAHKTLKSRREVFPMERTGLFSPDMKIIRNLSVSERALRTEPYEHMDFWLFAITESLKVRWEGEGLAAFAADGSVYTANSAEYQITRWRGDCRKPLLTFDKKAEPIPFDEDLQAQYVDDLVARMTALEKDGDRQKITRIQVEDAFRKSRPPSHTAPLVDLVAVEDLGLLAIREVNRRQRRTLADLFLPDGVYVGSINYQGIGLARMTFQNGYAHTLEQASSGGYDIVRYKYALKRM